MRDVGAFVTLPYVLKDKGSAIGTPIDLSQRNEGRCQLVNFREEHKALTKHISISLPPILVLSRCKDLLVHKNQLFLEVCP